MILQDGKNLHRSLMLMSTTIILLAFFFLQFCLTDCAFLCLAKILKHSRTFFSHNLLPEIVVVSAAKKIHTYPHVYGEKKSWNPIAPFVSCLKIYKMYAQNDSQMQIYNLTANIVLDLIGEKKLKHELIDSPCLHSVIEHV